MKSLNAGEKIPFRIKIALRGTAKLIGNAAEEQVEILNSNVSVQDERSGFVEGLFFCQLEANSRCNGQLTLLTRKAMVRSCWCRSSQSHFTAGLGETRLRKVMI